MAKIYCVMNRKGGTGKTTTTINTGAKLQNNGAKVLYIDMDSQRNLTKALHADALTLGVYDAMNRTAPAAACLGDLGAGSAILAGSAELSQADQLQHLPRPEYLLRDILQPIKGNFDYVFIDTPAALGILTINALTAADSVIITVCPEEWSADGIDLLTAAIDAVQRRTNPGLTVAGILITQNFPNTIFCRDMRDNLGDIARALNTRVFDTAISHSVKVKEANFFGANLFDYAPKSRPAEEYAAFTEELLKMQN